MVDLFHCLGIDGLLHRLTLPVQGAQLTGQPGGLRRVLTQQEVGGLVRCPHAAGGVDAGSQHEAHLHGGDGLIHEACLLQQGVEADEVRLGDALQATGDDDAVLPGHGHHVGNGADGGQGAVAGEKGLLPALAAQRQHQLQRHAAARQIGEGIGAVRPVGVHHRHGPWQGVLALVVIGDDHIHAQRGGEVHLLHPGDAAVHGDEQLYPLLMEGADGVLPQPVAVLNAARNIVQHIDAPAFQVIHQDHRGGDAVHVVIPEHRHAATLTDGPADALHRPVHVLHQEGGAGQIPAPLQKGGGLLRRGDAPCRQYLRHQLGIASLAETADIRFLRWGDMPFGKLHLPALPSAYYYNQLL